MPLKRNQDGRALAGSAAFKGKPLIRRLPRTRRVIGEDAHREFSGEAGLPYPGDRCLHLRVVDPAWPAHASRQVVRADEDGVHPHVWLAP